MNKRQYRGEDWKAQKEKCYKRDKYRCRDCGRKKSDGWVIQCHHLVDWKDTKDNRLKNLVTVCVGCHAKRHKIGFKKGNNYYKVRKNTVTPGGWNKGQKRWWKNPASFKKGHIPWNKKK